MVGFSKIIGPGNLPLYEWQWAEMIINWIQSKYNPSRTGWTRGRQQGFLFLKGSFSCSLQQTFTKHKYFIYGYWQAADITAQQSGQESHQKVLKYNQSVTINNKIIITSHKSISNTQGRSAATTRYQKYVSLRTLSPLSNWVSERWCKALIKGQAADIDIHYYAAWANPIMFPLGLITHTANSFVSFSHSAYTKLNDTGWWQKKTECFDFVCAQCLLVTPFPRF